MGKWHLSPPFLREGALGWLPACRSSLCRCKRDVLLTIPTTPNQPLARPSPAVTPEQYRKGKAFDQACFALRHQSPVPPELSHEVGGDDEAVLPPVCALLCSVRGLLPCSHCLPWCSLCTSCCAAGSCPCSPDRKTPPTHHHHRNPGARGQGGAGALGEAAGLRLRVPALDLLSLVSHARQPALSF